jgi:uncharacterized protein (DUF2147 family)
MTRNNFLAAALATAASTAGAAPVPPIAGNWTNPKHSVTVRIAPCGPALCGRVISATPEARDKAAAAGTPRLIGTELMSDLRPIGDGIWSGSMFVPDQNVRAQGEVRMIGPRTIEVEGCAMGGMLCKSQRWTRAGGPKAQRRPR